MEVQQHSSVDARRRSPQHQRRHRLRPTRRLPRVRTSLTHGSKQSFTLSMKCLSSSSSLNLVSLVLPNTTKGRYPLTRSNPSMQSHPSLSSSTAVRNMRLGVAGENAANQPVGCGSIHPHQAWISSAGMIGGAREEWDESEGIASSTSTRLKWFKARPLPEKTAELEHDDLHAPFWFTWSSASTHRTLRIATHRLSVGLRA